MTSDSARYNSVTYVSSHRGRHQTVNNFYDFRQHAIQTCKLFTWSKTAALAAILTSGQQPSTICTVSIWDTNYTAVKIN